MVIVGGGVVDLNIVKLLKARGAKLVGADGGGDVIAEADLVPDAIVGDFDSLKDPMSWLGRTHLTRISEQETTDFEKALYASDAPVTVAMGMTGKRLDHTMAAFDSLARHAHARRVILVDEHDIALAVSGKFAFSVAPGERVSVHALQPVTFKRSEGLKYPLDGLRLGPGLRTGTSNLSPSGEFSIEPKPRQNGVWLLILDRRNLLTLIGALNPAGRETTMGP
jgi:thiamine pyrophosphokinase